MAAKRAHERAGVQHVPCHLGFSDSVESGFEQPGSLGTPPAAMPEARKARRSPQVPKACAMLPGFQQRGVETGFSLGNAIRATAFRLCQQDFPFDPTQLRQAP